MRFRNCNIVAGVFLALSTSLLQAANVTVSLGQTAQNFVLTGLGPQISNGDGTYSITQGSCATAAGLVTCTMSGNITSASAAPYGSGTYSFITKYAASDVLPIQGQSQNPTSNNFFYQYLAPDVNMTLNLFTPGGNFIEPLVTNGAFDPGTGFGFVYASYVCAGLPPAVPCSQANVGQYVGATTTGPITISANFTVPDVVSPEPSGNALSGLSALLGIGLWLRNRIS